MCIGDNEFCVVKLQFKINTFIEFSLNVLQFKARYYILYKMILHYISWMFVLTVRTYSKYLAHFCKCHRDTRKDKAI